MFKSSKIYLTSIILMFAVHASDYNTLVLLEFENTTQNKEYDELRHKFPDLIKESLSLDNNINIEYEKWIRISKYDDSVREKLGKSFDKKAYEICKSKGDFKILKKIVEIIEMDETPAFGTEAKVRIGIQGVIECK